MPARWRSLLAVLLIGGGPALAACTPVPTLLSVDVVLTGLMNPRGVAFGPDGMLYVAEAGTGRAAVDPAEMTGQLTQFNDLNLDGAFDDAGEAEKLFSRLPTYNALSVFATGRDEVSGAGDVLLHGDGRLFLTVDGGFENQALYEISPAGAMGRNLAGRSNVNGIAFSPDQSRIYAVESSLNQLIEVPLDGQIRVVVAFAPLASGQQAVPAGVAINPATGHILVALFSGAATNEATGAVVPFVPGEAKVVSVNPVSGVVADEIAGLTTAVDVAADAAGNVYVVEMSAGYADQLPRLFDLYDRDAAPLHGGYQRFSGRVTCHPAGGGTAHTLVEGLDAPTNITVAPDGALYVSVGQGTPGRPIPGPEGPTRINGQVIRLSGFTCGRVHN